jgi:hypothetical protein
MDLDSFTVGHSLTLAVDGQVFDRVSAYEYLNPSGITNNARIFHDEIINAELFHARWYLKREIPFHESIILTSHNANPLLGANIAIYAQTAHYIVT